MTPHLWTPDQGAPDGLRARQFLREQRQRWRSIRDPRVERHLWAAAAFVQSSATASGSGNCSPTLASTTAGNALIIGFWQLSTGSRTYTCSGFTSAVQFNPSSSHQCVGIFYQLNCAGGSITPTVQSNTGTLTVAARLFEVSGLPLSSPTITTGTLSEGATSDNHQCASADVSIPADGFVLGVGTLNAAATSCDPVSPYLESTAGNQFELMYQIPVATVNDRGDWISVGTDRTGRSCMAAFAAAAAGVVGNAIRVNQAVNRASTY